MSFYYIFQNGKIILKENGAIPEATDAGKFRKNFLNSGCVDKEDNAAHAADASAGLPPEEIYDVRAGRGQGAARVGDRWAELDTEAALPEGFAACERRGCWTAVGEEQFFRIGKAFHIMDWQRLHKHCGRCGAANLFDPAEGAMRCPSCGELFYPVISPAIIVCVEKEGKILLGHGVNFPAGRYSVLAGFVEPGESLEECVAREVYEESRIRVKNIRYFNSQPWPFPRSLMLGFVAEWESGDICPDTTEVTDVRWFAPGEIPEYYRGISISAKLIEDFIKRHTKY